MQGRLLAVNAERHLRSSKDMRAIFSDLPQAIENTGAVSERLAFELDDLGYEFPRYPVPDGETMDSFLRKRVAEGVIKRYGVKGKPDLLAKVKKQVERELALIAKLRLCRILPDRLGHRAILQAEWSPDPGPR